MEFEQTFAGMLYLAGQKRSEKIEFLNAGVISYSPTIYYKKIKYLLDAGLKFDEVVVLSDLSDVQDEAIAYFCIDELAEFRRYCTEPPYTSTAKPTLTPVPGRHALPKADPKFKDNFAMTDRLLQMFWHEVDTRTGSGRRFADRLHMTQRAGWTMRSIDVDKAYQPLGVDGGIRRSVMHMEALAELLRSRGIGLTVAVYPWPFQLILQRPQEPSGRNLAHVLRETLHPLHRPVSGRVRGAGRPAQLVRGNVHSRRHPLFAGRQPRAVQAIAKQLM